MNYNTSREYLSMPEYGRHIQEMVNYVKTIEDPEVRQKNAEAIIELMGVLNPHLKNVEDFKHKLWDHLFTIAEFDLDVKSPYPLLTKEKLKRKPDPLPYPQGGKTHRHLGKLVLSLVEKAREVEDEDTRDAFTKGIAYYMKLAYNNWHKEIVHDEMIQSEIDHLSDGELHYNLGDVKLKFNNRNNNHSHKRHNNNNNRKKNYSKKRKH